MKILEHGNLVKDFPKIRRCKYCNAKLEIDEADVHLEKYKFSQDQTDVWQVCNCPECKNIVEVSLIKTIFR